eukprot:1174195-Rhodomonas_salina.2
MLRQVLSLRGVVSGSEDRQPNLVVELQVLIYPIPTPFTLITPPIKPDSRLVCAVLCTQKHSSTPFSSRFTRDLPRSVDPVGPTCSN